MDEVMLPEKLSDLLELALADLAKVEQSELYTVSLHRSFHQPSNGEPCSVCAAGAVMAATLGADPRRSLGPEDFCDWNAQRLSALDFLRLGDVRNAAYDVGMRGNDFVHLNRAVADYDEGARDEWKDDMRQLVADLRREGL